MKEKRDCKIIQDLLPNYIEKLTNDETNKYIEEHLNKCEECKGISEDMQEELKLSNSKIDDREIKYFKKFNKKFNILRNTLLIIILVIILIISRKTFILITLSNKAQETQKSENYYLKVESYLEGQMTITEAYYKQEKSLVKIVSYTKDLGETKQILYKSGEERFALVDNGEKKIFKRMGDISVQPVAFTSEFFLDNLYTAITTNIEKINLKGTECYIIKDGNTEQFIDANTGIAIKMIDNENNQTVDYKYEYGVVKDTDVAKPDITGYEVID